MKNTQVEKYNFSIVRWFVLLAVIYLAVGTLVGLIIAVQLSWPAVYLHIPFLSFAHLQSLHASVVVFAFGGCSLIAAVYYSVQRTCSVRLWSDVLGWFVLVGLNLIFVYTAFYAVCIRLFLGITSVEEFASLRLEIDSAIVLVLVAFTVNFVMTIVTRKAGRIYVSNWFFMGMIVMVAYLYVNNSIAIPARQITSFSMPAVAHDTFSTALFYLSTGFLGMMYYIVPQQAKRPIFSYRLAVIHICTLMLGCVWLGAHNLKHAAIPIPDWIDSFGGTVSLALIIVSLGGFVNFILTISGSWDKLRTDYILRFLLVSLIFYAISSIESPVLSFVSVNDLSSYTDWTVGDAHSYALGCVSMACIGALYHLAEKLWNTSIYSAKLVNLHFWMSIVGVVVYIGAMQVSGIMQGLMWRAYDESGALAYTFAESVEAMHPYYVMRVVGGVIYMAGVVVMLYNLAMTIRQAAGQRELTDN